MNNINVYIGYDSQNYGQRLAYEICKRSILKNHISNIKINIFPLIKKDLENKGIFYRNDNTGSTEFTYTRFLVPFLNNYSDYAIFCDSDFLWQCDIVELLEYINDDIALSCVKHEYLNCQSNIKMDGLKQEWYPRKNWSSLMIFNCGHPEIQKLNINNVNSQSPSWLHRFTWCNDEFIGAIPKTYNYLVGYYNDEKNPKGLHYTDGGPWYKSYRNVLFSKNWINFLTFKEKKQLFDE